MRKQKKKQKKQPITDAKPVSTADLISKTLFSSENIVRLKVTSRKGARIESVPLKKLEKLSEKTRLYWKLEEGWLILYGS